MDDDLDPAVAERALGEYPELLDYWRQEMKRPDRDDHYGPKALRRMHDPVYLGEVVREHRSLLAGTNQPDERLARRCEEIVATFPPVRDERARQLADPWFHARVEPYHVTKLYDPEYPQRHVDIRRKGADPFSEESLRFEQFMAIASMGAVITETDIATGEVTDQWEIGPQPGDRRRRRCVGAVRIAWHTPGRLGAEMWDSPRSPACRACAPSVWSG
jgi:hypothetical protein